ncbi:MAG: diguanylate cyclase (GGDEF)-like protein [Flavobacteriales bacterium]|jgi:diguanylate cyclase (GGDEF)-like protein
MSDSDMMSFLGESSKDESKETVKTKPPVWRILITDDEKDVHSATSFALRNTKIMGRRIEFLHAASAEEALRVLKAESDIAVILLDVVMETPNAGLDLVAVIREELNIHDSRIILRTGQPNQAPEIEVIRDYDINDYKLKSELTQNKLYASLTTAVRSYQQIKMIEAGKVGLNMIVKASSELMTKKGLHEFAQGVIFQLSALLSVPPEGLICVRRTGDVGCTQKTEIIAAAGHYCALIDHPLTDMTEDIARKTLIESLDNKCNVYTKTGIALYLGSSERGDMSCYVASADAIREVDKDLLELFVSNISVCADNLELVERLRGFAYEDQLTHLGNRNLLNEKVQEILDSGREQDYSLAVLDIDNFAEINLALGQEYGDELLKAVADRVRECFSNSACIARVAGDAYAILAESSALGLQEVVEPFNRAFDVENHQQILSVTAGVIPLKEIGGEAQNALKHATVILKVAKSENRGEAIFYQPEILELARGRLGILKNLRAAFENKQLFLVYQPKFNLSDNSISGFEALLRWRDNDGNIIFPDKFISIAEQSGLIVRMGEWVLRTAMAELKAIHANGWTSTHMSINVSAAQLRHSDFLPMLSRVVAESDVEAQYIDLEITESMAMQDADAALNILNKVKELGFTLSIDDFGTGFSSLSQLQKMPLDRLKIDQSFVRTSNEESGREIVEMIIQLANTLEIKVIAEGVEKNSELDLLKKLDCDEIQGFLYAKPMSKDALYQWMKDNKNLNK